MLASEQVNHRIEPQRVPLPACGERSDREAVRVRGRCHRSEPLRIAATPPHPNPLPASGEREHAVPAATLRLKTVTLECTRAYVAATASAARSAITALISPPT
jgi:hypothetical protein